MKQDKDRLLDDLRRLVERDSYWFTRDQQDMLLTKIDEIGRIMDGAYERLVGGSV